MRIKIYLSMLATISAVVNGFAPKSAALATAARQQNQVFRCTVKDPTGTPLNVRSSPGGKKIVARLKNGTRVWVENFSGDAKDQSWAEVKQSPKRGSKALGWVLQDLLECDD